MAIVAGHVRGRCAFGTLRLLSDLAIRPMAPGGIARTFVIESLDVLLTQSSVSVAELAGLPGRNHHRADCGRLL